MEHLCRCSEQTVLGGVGPGPVGGGPSPVGVWEPRGALWPGTCLQLGLPRVVQGPGWGPETGGEWAPAATRSQVMVRISGSGLGSFPCRRSQHKGPGKGLHHICFSPRTGQFHSETRGQGGPSSGKRFAGAKVSWPALGIRGWKEPRGTWVLNASSICLAET